MNLKERIEEIQKKLAQWEFLISNATPSTSIVLDAIQIKLLLQSLEQSLRVINKQWEIIEFAKYNIAYGLGSSIDDIRISTENTLNKIKEMEENDTD